CVKELVGSEPFW
nr:immunoglobulin heavy chain junction region [Macaca mulatta]